VRSGRLRRAVAVLYLRELFNGKLERTSSELWDCLLASALHLSAAELLPEIRRAYEDGLISPEFDLEEIEEALSKEWEDFDRVISQAFPGQRRPPLDHMTGKGWWTRSNQKR